MSHVGYGEPDVSERTSDTEKDRTLTSRRRRPITWAGGFLLAALLPLAATHTWHSHTTQAWRHRRRSPLAVRCSRR
jgi:hypothetical protein